MAAFDPNAAIALDAALFAQFAAEDAALTLGGSAQQLIAIVNVGDVIPAQVLPPQNGTDRIALLGQTVDAQLPPGIDPGETILLSVTALQGNQIVVKNLGAAGAPAQPDAAVAGDEPPAQPQQALLITTQPHAEAQQQAGEAPQPVAPPSEPSNSTPSAASAATAEFARTPRANVQPAVSAPGGEPATAALRTEWAPVAPPREVFVAASVLAPAPQRVVRPAAANVQAAFKAPVNAAQLREFNQEANLLARLRVPVSTATLAAARAASGAASGLPKVFERLDTLLAKIPQPGEAVVSLRALLPFIGRMDLANARALPQQLAAFVSHVFDGTEGKIADIVRVVTASEAPAQSGAQSQSAAQAQTNPAGTNALGIASASAQPLELNLGAQIQMAERDVALTHSLKAMIAAVAASPGAPAGLPQALGDAMRTVTAMQLQALARQDVDPKTLVIPLPVQFRENGAPAELRVAKDAPGGGRIDADNFSISFVLDTKTMGTVGIDVRTVGRAVSVDVKTERPRAAERFRGRFDDLRGRLAQLRYRVASMNAGTLEKRNAASQPSAVPQEAFDAKSREWRA